jgi:hypothetical protein
MVVQLGRKKVKNLNTFSALKMTHLIGNLLASIIVYINRGTSMISSQTRVLKELYLLPQRPPIGGLEGAEDDTSFYYKIFLHTCTAKGCRICDVLMFVSWISNCSYKI